MKSFATVLSLHWFLFAFISTIAAESLYCYECEGDDCSKLGEDKVHYCGADTTTVSPPGTGVPPETETSVSSESSLGTDATITTEVTAETATPPPSETFPETDSTLNPTTSVGTDATTIAETTAETATSLSTDTTSEIDASTNPEDSAETDTTLTTESVAKTTTKLDTSVNPETSTETGSPARTETFTTGPEIIPGASPEFNVKTPNASATLIRGHRSVSRANRADATGYACYRIQIPVNGSTNGEMKLKLGCIAIPDEQSACQAVRTELGLSQEGNDECTACQNNICNGSAMAQWSIAAILCVVFAKLLV